MIYSDLKHVPPLVWLMFSLKLTIENNMYSSIKVNIFMYSIICWHIRKTHLLYDAADVDLLFFKQWIDAELITLRKVLDRSALLFCIFPTITHLSRRGAALRRGLRQWRECRLAVKRDVRCLWRRNIGSEFHSLPCLFWQLAANIGVYTGPPNIYLRVLLLFLSSARAEQPTRPRCKHWQHGAWSGPGRVCALISHENCVVVALS